MFRFLRPEVVAAAALFIAVGSSPVLAQSADGSGPGNTWAGTYSGPGNNPPGSYPIMVGVGYNGVFAGAAAGNGTAGVGAGTTSGGQVNSVGASTDLPSQLCLITSVPYDCQ